ncbi:MAG: thiamine-phosphate pyrophosphorylase [Acidobacteriaceae bacterium]|nr:thiamine-phosphate pyrophosphorylase [Acidobacteriaceae bacterium]
MTRSFHLPRFYPILDAEALWGAGLSLEAAARALHAAGVRWTQYRDKAASDGEVVERMRLLRTVFPPGESTLILNDRVHLCAITVADGLHIGQEDMPPGEARRMLGEDRLLGVSTHNAEQLTAALATGAADYVAIGPVFGTQSKRNPDPVVGLNGLANARALTDLPLVAIGGITEENAPAVIEAGADAVAVISALLPEGGLGIEQRVRDFLARLR